MSSIASNASSVSFRGEEMDVDTALDTLFRELQDNLNHCHCAVRNLAQSEERAETYIEAAGYHFEIEDYVDTLLGLFTELKSVSKEVLGRPPPETREEFKALVEKRKAEKKRLKEEQKQIRQMQKMILSEIKE